jgi:hypothetical protein
VPSLRTAAKLSSLIAGSISCSQSSLKREHKIFPVVKQPWLSNNPGCQTTPVVKQLRLSSNREDL